MEGDAQDIPPGTVFRTLRGNHAGGITTLLGAGGQGAVYAADFQGTQFAVKWYHPSYAAVDQGLRRRLSRAIERGAPNGTFLWPIDIVEIPGQKSFGYLMRLRDPGYAGMRDLIARPPARLEPPFAVRATICLYIVESFLELHASGFCYQDINFGNVFFQPVTGEILICDNDNVDIDGAVASVYGTRKFMAPEIVRHLATPNTKSDLFSMAVLFFYVLHAWHPLDGKREAAVNIMDAAAETELYGSHPVFLFDPNDASNGPLEGMHEPIVARWNALPSGLRSLFTRSFTLGLHQPGSRVQEAEWRPAFASMLTGAFACPGCGFEHAVEVSAGPRPHVPSHCAACAAPQFCPPVLLIGRIAICLLPGRRIPLHMLMPGRPFDIKTAGAAVEEHPTRPGVMGLRNNSGDNWRMRPYDESEVTVPPGSAMRLLDRAIVDFGRVSGTVVMPDHDSTIATRSPAAGVVRGASA
jgi:serine/threonine protein kinase